VTEKNEPPVRGIETRFRDLSADVRLERVVRYVVHQVNNGRHVNDILNDQYVVEHLDEAARNHILEHPDVIKSVEQQIRGYFAGHGGPTEETHPGGGDQDAAGRTNDADLPDV
jgi:hypothetical protein